MSDPEAVPRRDWRDLYEEYQEPSGRRDRSRRSRSAGRTAAANADRPAPAPVSSRRPGRGSDASDIVRDLAEPTGAVQPVGGRRPAQPVARTPQPTTRAERPAGRDGRPADRRPAGPEKRPAGRGRRREDGVPAVPTARVPVRDESVPVPDGGSSAAEPPAGPHSRRDVVLAALGAVALLGVVFVLTKAAQPLITIMSVLSGNEPRVYAALLAVLVSVPGLLFTLPRAANGSQRAIARAAARGRGATGRSHLVTDVIGVCFFLLSQVPIPAPWGPTGKAATVANITRSAEVVELSRCFAVPSLLVVLVGIAAAALAVIFRHAAGMRVVSIVLVASAPVLGWFYLTHTVSM